MPSQLYCLAFKAAQSKLLTNCRTLLWLNSTSCRFVSTTSSNESTENASTLPWKSQHKKIELPSDDQQKVIKLALVGAPNAGKSSIINEFINRRVCPTSYKVHTTYNYSRTIYNMSNVQAILYDTPGMVTDAEIKKYAASKSFISSCRHSIQNSDLIAVVHDVSNPYTRNKLHPSVLETLKMYEQKPSVLILNKIDMIRGKRILLDLVNVLTENTLRYYDRRYLPWKGNEKEFEEKMMRPVKYKTETTPGWPGFADVFMVSGLTGSGIGRLKKYAFEKATDKPWEYTNGEYTDQPPEKIIINHVRAVILDYLPQDIPYKLQVEMEYLDEKNDRIFAYINVICPTERLRKLVCGGKNNRMQQIAETANSDLLRLYQLSVSLVINTVCRQKPVEGA